MMKNYRETDPEFAERLEHFAFDEVVNEPGQQLDEVTRHMAILATLLGCQGAEAFRRALPQALDAGVTPVMAKEIVYQAVDYLGMGRVLPFLDITNEVLTERGVALPLEVAGGLSKGERRKKVEAALKGGRKLVGVLSAADSTSVTLEYSVLEKTEGSKKKTPVLHRDTFPMEEVNYVKYFIEFD